MKGWILYKDSANLLKPETYEINRFMDVAKEEGIELEILRQHEKTKRAFWLMAKR